MALPDRCVRRATITDLPFVLKAQASMPHDLDAASEEEIAYALATGEGECYVLMVDGQYRSVLALQVAGENALLSAFYREGPPEGLRADAKTILDVVLPLLKSRGVAKLFCRVSLRNPKYRRLVKFYGRMLKVKPENVTLSGRI